MYPIIFTDATRIDHVGAIVFGVCEHKIRMRHFVISAGGARLLGERNSGSLPNCVSRSFRSPETDTIPTEIVEPPAYFRRRAPHGISGHKNELNLIRHP